MSWRASIQRNVREITVRCCNDSAHSAGTRAFVLNNFHEIKALNPTFPFLVRESQGYEPCFDVVYYNEVVKNDDGYTLDPPKTETRMLTDMSEAEVLAVLKEVVAAGAGAPQVTSKVPIPMAEALKQDLRHGDFHSISWPGPALEYKHAAMNK